MWCSGPLSPAIVSVKILPAPFFVRNFNVLLAVAGFGANVAVLPVGVPLTLKVTEPANPFREVTVTA